MHTITSRARLRLAGLVTLWLALASPAHAASGEHPLIGRYEGATPAGFQQTAYDELRLLTGPLADRSGDPAGWQTFEGKITRAYYRLPEGRSALEVQRNYEQSLKAKGFDIPFTCSAEAGTCVTGGRPQAGLALGLALDTPEMPRLGLPDHVRNLFYHGGARHLYARRTQPDGTVHATLSIADNPNGRFVLAQIVESAAMDTGQITLTDTDALDRALAERGNVDLYGILFATDSADITPASDPQLQAIARLLTRHPTLQLNVIGHTDNQGGADYNLALSQRRAQAVATALTTHHGIAANRLHPTGRGLQAPVASNADDAGRARNRRVELEKR